MKKSIKHENKLMKLSNLGEWNVNVQKELINFVSPLVRSWLARYKKTSLFV